MFKVNKRQPGVFTVNFEHISHLVHTLFGFEKASFIWQNLEKMGARSSHKSLY